MRPPDCEACGRRFDPSEGGLVRFRSRPSDLEWRERAGRENPVGHPPDTGWFCPDHVRAAEASTELVLGDAVLLIASDLPVAGVVRHFEDRGPSIAISADTTDVSVLAGALEDAVPRFRRALGIPDLGPLEHAANRRWTPMDGATPPSCPHGDEDLAVADDGEYEIRLSHVRNFWNDTEMANASTRLWLGRRGRDGSHDPAAGGFRHSIGAGTNRTRGLSALVESVTIFPPLNEAFLKVVAEVLSAIAGG